MLSKILVLWLAAFPLMGSPGPATLSLAAVGSAFGIKKCFAYYLGIVLGTAGVLLMIAVGLTGLLLAQPKLAFIITLAAAAYILYLAYCIATAPVGGEENSNAPVPRLRSGFFLAIANPKAFAAIGAVYSGNVLNENNVYIDAAVKITALLLVIITVNFIWLVGGSAFSASLTNPQVSRVVNWLFAVLLVISVGLAILA